MSVDALSCQSAVVRSRLDRSKRRERQLTNPQLGACAARRSDGRGDQRCGSMGRAPAISRRLSNLRSLGSLSDLREERARGTRPRHTQAQQRARSHRRWPARPHPARRAALFRATRIAAPRRKLPRGQTAGGARAGPRILRVDFFFSTAFKLEFWLKKINPGGTPWN